MNTLEFFHSLPGRWAISRSIPGHARGQGEARFSQIKNEENALHYQEQGKLSLEGSGQTMDCYKDYIYRYQAERDTISVHFVDEESTNRLFHLLQLSVDGEISVGKATHHCGQDTYDIVYQSIDKDAFEVIYKVKGPKKDYESQTYFQRQ